MLELTRMEKEKLDFIFHDVMNVAI